MFLSNLNAEIVACILLFRKSRHKPNLESSSKYSYNIASRAAQSNSVYASVLQISIVHSRADGVSKSLSQKIFFARAAIVSTGQNVIFRDHERYKQRLGPPVPKRRQFSDLFSWARVLKREKNNGKGDSALEPSRFASLSEGEIGEMQQILTERHSGKTKQMTNWSVSTFKVKLKFFRFKII